MPAPQHPLASKPPGTLQPGWAVLVLSAALPWIPSPRAADDGALRRLENSEAGLSISGKALSRFQRAELGGDSAKPGQTTRENAAFTQAEVELSARPGEHSRGRLLLRIHQDWSNYYDEGPNPLTARWFDFRGELFQDRVRFAVGDYRGRHTPLTLYAPEPELLYEPALFAGKRQAAMGEFFLGDHRLPLQGLNAGYAHELVPAALGIDADVAVARLRNVHSGSTSWFHWTDDVEKVMLASAAKFRLFDAAAVGYAQTAVVDDLAASRARNNALAAAQRMLLPQPLYEDNHVHAFSLDLDGARWTRGGRLALSLESEYALSRYRGRLDTADTAALTVGLKEARDLEGTALRSVFQAAYGSPAEGPFALSLSLGWLSNDGDFVSDLAQSPTFRGRRILNSRSEVGGYQKGYHTLDALYHHRYAVDPITSLNSSEQWYVDARTYNGINNWYRAPFLKNSYGFYTTTRSEREAMAAAGALDPHVQLLFPFGPATPNREGITLDFKASALSGALEAAAAFAGLEEKSSEPIDSLDAIPAEFGRVGGGLRLRLGKFLALGTPLDFSGSYMVESRRRPAFSSRGVAVAAEDFESALLNAGFQAGVGYGLSVLGGYQSIQSNPALWTVTPLTRDNRPGDLRQDQWSVGLEYRIKPGAYVTAEYGRLGFEEAVTGTAYRQDVTSLNLVIAY